MTIGKNLDTGEMTITLNKEESQLFTEGKVVRKYSGDSLGAFTVKLQLERPKPETVPCTR
jgi:hypothetical protein